MTLTLEDLRFVGAWAADCAERVLPSYEKKAPVDRRPREAIDGIRLFAREGKRTAQLRKLALAAHAAAREVDDPVAKAAARAAGMAAATAYTHPLATLDQAKHILGTPVYAAHARELAAGDWRVADAEIRWAVRRASGRVCQVLRRFPARTTGRTRLQMLYYQVDSGLRNVGRRNKTPPSLLQDHK